MRRVLGFAAWIAAILIGFPAMAQDVVGEVVSVSEGARLERDGRRFSVAPAISILSGDTIVTNRTGTVLLTFRDDTKVVVGPNSQLVAADIRMRRNGRARQFSVNTVGGTFRFLSGDSAKRVYDIRTPTATMGVRGTEFDFAVGRSSGATLVTFDGQVKMCGRDRRCYAVSGSCATLRAGGQGIDPNPVEGNQKFSILEQQFPFTQSQAGLGGQFRTSLLGCGRDDDEDDPNFDPVVVVEVPAVERPGGSGPADADAQPDPDDGGGGPRSGP